MKRLLVCATPANRTLIAELLDARAEVQCVRARACLDHLSRAQSLGLEVTAVIVDQLKTARALRGDIDDLGFEIEVVEWRGDAREFEEEMQRVLFGNYCRSCLEEPICRNRN